MKRLIYATALLAAAALLLGSGCRKEDDDCFDEGNPRCSNYDPCHNRRTPVSAAFEVLIVNIFDERYTLPSGDTVLANTYLRFVALDTTPGTTYTWEVGNPQNTSVSREYFLAFICQDVLGAPIPVRLIAARLADSDCLAEHERQDTVVRRLQFLPRTMAAYWGRWEGALDSKPDEVFTMELHYTEQSPGAACPALDFMYISNLPNDMCQREGGIGDMPISTYDKIVFERAWDRRGPLVCLPPPGYIDTELKNTSVETSADKDSILIRFEYHLFTSGGVADRKEDLVFRGRRVP
jgi:hypothetical protein